MEMSAVLADDDKRKALVIASKCCIDSNTFAWYDSEFLRLFEAAKRFLKIILPDRLDEFTRAFDVLRTDPGYRVQHLEKVFDDRTFKQVVETVHTLPYVALEHYESGTFGRSLLRRHPFFTELQESLTATVSELVGEAVAPAYNFLSLYRGVGKCDPHLDQPLSKWTLDICIEQSVEWPIFFSQVIDWPSDGVTARTIENLRADPTVALDSVVLTPNRGAIFSGSSQWHFRDPIPGGCKDFCHLLFFHYLPQGAQPLAEPKHWADHFGIPELEILVMADSMVNRGRLQVSDGMQAAPPVQAGTAP
jgi:hypothetical protein